MRDRRTVRFGPACVHLERMLPVTEHEPERSVQRQEQRPQHQVLRDVATLVNGDVLRPIREWGEEDAPAERGRRPPAERVRSPEARALDDAPLPRSCAPAAWPELLQRPHREQESEHARERGRRGPQVPEQSGGQKTCLHQSALPKEGSTPGFYNESSSSRSDALPQRGLFRGSAPCYRPRRRGTQEVFT